jgi:hypothetical protein
MNDYIAGLLIRERLRDERRAADVASQARRAGGAPRRRRAAAVLRRAADRVDARSMGEP